MLIEDASYLYIEDHPASQKVMELLLKEVCGVSQLMILSDSEDIVQRLETSNKTFDLIFLDMHIEPDNGFIVLEKLRRHPRLGQPKIVAVTATIMPEELKAIRHASFDGLISKPISFDTFPQQVQRILLGEKNVWGGL